MRKVLLIEPNYSNKYPPIGLMKMATYFRQKGDEVVFFKGDLKEFVIERITLKCIEACAAIDDSVDWKQFYSSIYSYIKTRKNQYLSEIDFSISEFNCLIEGRIIDYKDYYWKGLWKQNPEWDFIAVTTLFTFYWDITIKTIEMAKLLIKPTGHLMVGGVLASIQPKEIEAATGVKPHVGVLNVPGVIDKDDTQIIDELPLDYSILDEIDYEYPMSNAYYGYTSRGCIRKCSFCAVSTLEPHFISYIPLQDRIKGIRELYGDQKDLLLMDNNVLASPDFESIINDILACGFGKDDKFVQPNIFEISVRNLRNSVNDRAYIRKCQKEIVALYDRLKNKHVEDAYEVYKTIDKYHLKEVATINKDALLLACDVIAPIYEKHFRAQPRQRYVDFNQGVDARLFNEENVKLLAKTSIRPLRIAFDSLKTRKWYEKAIRLSVNAGLSDFSNYLLYNYQDKPYELYERLRINVDLCEELNVKIYSFPMKYHPLHKEKGAKEDFSHNRDFIGEHWNRKYIRAIQAILNSTKGKVGRGVSFFEKAFGKDLHEYEELLEMPETFILYRFFFTWLDDKIGFGIEHWRACWRKCMAELDEDTKAKVVGIIHSNNFDKELISSFESPLVRELFSYYNSDRNDVLTPTSELYALKKEYDANPTIQLKRKSADT
jgi:hypothetical protein